MHALGTLNPSGWVACHCGPATPVVTRTQVLCSDSVCQTRAGSVCFEADFLGCLFCLCFGVFFEGLIQPNGFRICPPYHFHCTHVFQVTFVKLLFELAGKLLEKQLSLM